MHFTEKADSEFMDSLAVICEIFGAIYRNPDARTLVVLSTDRRAEKVLKEQLAQMVVDNAPLNWHDTAT